MESFGEHDSAETGDHDFVVSVVLPHLIEGSPQSMHFLPPVNDALRKLLLKLSVTKTIKVINCYTLGGIAQKLSA